MQTGNYKTEQAAHTHLPWAGSRMLTRGVRGAGQAGQQQLGMSGRGLLAVQEVFHQPAAEQGSRALELHPLHLKLNT